MRPKETNSGLLTSVLSLGVPVPRTGLLAVFETSVSAEISALLEDAASNSIQRWQAWRRW